MSEPTQGGGSAAGVGGDEQYFNFGGNSFATFAERFRDLHDVLTEPLLKIREELPNIPDKTEEDIIEGARDDINDTSLKMLTKLMVTECPEIDLQALRTTPSLFSLLPKPDRLKYHGPEVIEMSQTNNKVEDCLTHEVQQLAENPAMVESAKGVATALSDLSAQLAPEGTIAKNGGGCFATWQIVADHGVRAVLTKADEVLTILKSSPKRDAVHHHVKAAADDVQKCIADIESNFQHQKAAQVFQLRAELPTKAIASANVFVAQLQHINETMAKLRSILPTLDESLDSCRQSFDTINISILKALRHLEEDSKTMEDGNLKASALKAERRAKATDASKKLEKILVASEDRKNKLKKTGFQGARTLMQMVEEAITLQRINSAHRYEAALTALIAQRVEERYVEFRDSPARCAIVGAQEICIDMAKANKIALDANKALALAVYGAVKNVVANELMQLEKLHSEVYMLRNEFAATTLPSLFQQLLHPPVQSRTAVVNNKARLEFEKSQMLCTWSLDPQAQSARIDSELQSLNGRLEDVDKEIKRVEGIIAELLEVTEYIASCEKLKKPNVYKTERRITDELRPLAIWDDKSGRPTLPSTTGGGGGPPRRQQSDGRPPRQGTR